MEGLVVKNYVNLSFDGSGTVTVISYSANIDVHASFGENLHQIEQDFKILQAPLENLNVSVENPELLASYKLPDEFKEAFLTGTLHDSFDIHTNHSSVHISCSFHTPPEEEFNEYSRPYVFLSFRNRD